MIYLRRAMKTILVLSNHPDFAEAIRAGLDAERYRVVHRLTVDEAEPLLVHGLVAASILDADLMGVEGVWADRTPPPPRRQIAGHRLHFRQPNRLGRRKLFCAASPMS